MSGLDPRRVTDWRGWQHDRWVHFYHNEGPIIVMDDAHGPAVGRAELMWHVTGHAEDGGTRIRLRNGDNPAELTLVPVLSAGQAPVIKAEGTDSSQLPYRIPRPKGGCVCVVFLLAHGLAPM